MQYKASHFYAPSCEGSIRWDDQDIGVKWPLDGIVPILSDKDGVAPGLADLTALFAYDGDPLGALEEVKA